jgi:hypothetical protein
MKKLMAIMLLTILSTVCIFAQHGADGQELTGLDNQWSAAIDRRDSNSIDALNGITATDLTSHGGALNNAPYNEPTFQGGSQLFTTQLEGRYSSTSPWENELSLSPIFTKIYLRWGTNRRGITSAEWQMTNSPNGFSDNNPNIIASGQLNVIPSPLQRWTVNPAFNWRGESAINFKQFLPESVEDTQIYYVRVVPRNALGEKFPSSGSIKINYINPTRFRIDPPFRYEPPPFISNPPPFRIKKHPGQFPALALSAVSK